MQDVTTVDDFWSDPRYCTLPATVSDNIATPSRVRSDCVICKYESQ